MRNLVALKIDLQNDYVALSAAPLVATFTLTASHLNMQDAVLKGTDGKEILLPSGVQYRFERLDLTQVQVKSKVGEAVFVVGYSG